MLHKRPKTLARRIALVGVTFVSIAVTGCASPPDGCILGQWRGTYVTEAVNVQLDLTISGLGVGDAGNWSFTGAEDVALGSGDLQAWQMGSSATIIIFRDLAGPFNSLVGAINGNCDHIEGDIGGGNIGRFSIDRL